MWGLVARQAKELGIKAPLLGGDGWDSPKLKEIGGNAIEGSYFANHYSAEDQSPVVQEFITKYKAAYGVVQDGLAAMGYDAGIVLADSIKRSKSMAAQDLRDAIAATKDFLDAPPYQNMTNPATAMTKAVPRSGSFEIKTTARRIQSPGR